MKRFAYIFLLLLSITALAVTPSPRLSTPRGEEPPKDTIRITRWRVQPTAPVEVADLDSSALDLRMPENVKQQVEYNDSLNV